MITKRIIGKVTWIDLLSPTTAEARTLTEEHGIHPLAMHDLVLPTIRPKIENYGNYIYMVLHFPSYNAAKGNTYHEIDFIVGKNFLLTARYESIDAFHRFERTVDANAMIEHNTTSTLNAESVMLLLLRTMYSSLDEALESVKDSLDDIEQRIFKGEEKSMVFKISTISRELLSFRHCLDPHSEILLKLSEHGNKVFGHEYVGQVVQMSSELNKIISTVKRYSESLSELRITNDSLLETKQGEMIKLFTVITVISSFVTIISSWFLVDSPDRPFKGNSHEFWYVGLILFLTAFLMALAMKKKKWL